MRDEVEIVSIITKIVAAATDLDRYEGDRVLTSLNASEQVRSALRRRADASDIRPLGGVDPGRKVTSRLDELDIQRYLPELIYQSSIHLAQIGYGCTIEYLQYLHLTSELRAMQSSEN